MKIIYCIPSTYNSGGMERVLSTKANHLADKCGFDVIIVTTSQAGRPHFYPLSDRIRHIDLGINYEEMMALPLHRRMLARMKAKRTHKAALSTLLHREKPDITVSMFTHEMSFLPSINDGSKKVLELHFSRRFRALDAASNGVGTLMKWINRALDYSDRRAIGAYDRFVVLSHRDAADWGGKFQNITVISNPSTFATTCSDQADVFAKKALAVGRLCPQKGFDMLVDAWRKIPESARFGWTLDIVGSGPDKSKLLQTIAKAGLEKSITILPPTSDVKTLYQSHSIFCFPSRYEGFPLSLMEAMSFGLPPVAFDCPCGPSELISDGVNGYLISPEDVDSFSGRLTALMQSSHLRETIGRRALHSISTNFSEPHIMDKWITLFTTLATKE